MRVPLLAWPWLPIWVATPYSLAALAIMRASQMVWEQGFWTKTCLPICMAIMATGKWVWSGVLMVTASISSPRSLSMAR